MLEGQEKNIIFARKKDKNQEILSDSLSYRYEYVYL